MLKRPKGYLLLTMLVLTGLAGRLHSDTLSGKERRFLINELKTSKAAFTESIKGLSKKQINFKTDKNNKSIKDCIYHIAFIQNNLWQITKNGLKMPANTIHIKKTNDAEMAGFLENQLQHPEHLIPFKKESFISIDQAMKSFKNDRAELLRYVRTTTENVRAHTAQTPHGSFDAYQVMLMKCVYTNFFTGLIVEIKSSPNFPE